MHNYAKVKYANVYPGVDLVYYGNQGKLEYDFVVQPGRPPLHQLAIRGPNLSECRREGWHLQDPACLHGHAGGWSPGQTDLRRSRQSLRHNV